MAKEKVYNLAKEFNVSSEALVQILKSMGIPVKGHMSTVDESLREKIKEKFEQERTEIKNRYARKRKRISKAKNARTAAKASKTEKPQKESVKEKTGEAKTGEAHQKKEAAPAEKRRVHRPYKSSSRGSGNIQEWHDEAGELPGAKTKQDKDAKETQSEGKKSKKPEKKGKAENKKTEHKKSDNKTEKGKSDKKQEKGRSDRSRSERGKKRREKTKAAAQDNIKKTLAKIEGTGKKRYKKQQDKEEDSGEQEKETLKVSEFVTVQELSNMIQVPATEVIAKCMQLGLFVTINQRLDFETLELVADEFGYNVSLMDEYAQETKEAEEKDDREQISRAPVITVMGHVDHGKTSVLDYIRESNVIAGESGGITQHIAAYEVKADHGSITFLDTPGHEAFTSMRARGSQVTDVVVIVVAADAGVMPQTKEAINHAKAAEVPIVIAINKCDLPTANPDKIKSELAQNNIVVEDYGGEISCIEISAKTGQGIDKLLEVLALESEILELKAPKSGLASGVVVESEMSPGKGSTATVLIQKGTLKKGDPFITGIYDGRVREMFNERGKQLTEAGPSKPVIVLGLSGTPQAGDTFRVTEDPKEARSIAAKRRLAQKERETRKVNAISLENLSKSIQEGNVQSLNLIIKGDVDGSVEALAASLEKLTNDEIKVNILHKGVGGVTEADIMLASTSDAIIIAFHIHPNPKIKEVAERQNVEIRTYRVIYEVLDDVQDAMEGMLAPEIREKALGTVEIREVFKTSKFGQIAGCYVKSGIIKRNAKARLIRDDIEVMDTVVESLKRHQNDASEVKEGYECGIILKGRPSYEIGDRIEAYETVEIARKLEKRV